MGGEAWEWLSHLRSLGYDVPGAGDLSLLQKPQNISYETSVSAQSTVQRGVIQFSAAFSNDIFQILM